MGKVATESTLREGVDLLKSIAANGIPRLLTYADIRRAIRAGFGSVYFDIGDQISTPYRADDGKTYQAPWDVKHIDDTGVYFGMHYAVPEEMVFDAPEAIYAVKEELAAGTYHITVGEKYGKGWQQGQNIQFTIAKPVPAGGEVYIDFGANYDLDPTSGRKVETYATAGILEALETTTTSPGSGGANLGTMVAAKTTGNLNSISRCVSGYNRYAQSAIRQWLNSSAGADGWWKPQNEWDRPPTSRYLKKPGFLSRLPSDFIDMMDKVEVVTAIRTTESVELDRDTTLDKVFLPSIQNLCVTPQLADAEAPVWDYYKQLAQEAGLTEFAQWKPYEIMQHYRLNSSPGRLSPCVVRLRSANRTTSSGAWYIYANGTAGTDTVQLPYMCCPACKVKKIK